MQPMNGMTMGEVSQSLGDGARIRVFEYVLSFVLVTFKKRSPAYVLGQGEHLTWKLGLRYNLLSLLLGWGFVPPWGFINTVDAIKSNLNGGLDITDEVATDIRIFMMSQGSAGRGDTA